jgi:NarL family two-component system response regulator LiaR
MEKIKLFIVDDDQIWLKGFSAFLDNQSDFSVVGTASNKEEAINFIKNFETDLILMDLNLVGDKYDGIDVTQDILKIKNVKVIILTSIEDKDVVVDAFAAGAVNFLNKYEFEAIPHAIRTSLSSKSPVEILGREYSRLREENILSRLTLAEREVYELRKSGYSFTQIGEKLHKSISTIKKQMNQILKKLDVSRFKDIHNLKKASKSKNNKPA